MPASMIIAPVGSSFMVSGRSIAIVAGGPNPGSTPTTVPSTTPSAHIIRLFAVNATWNPCRSPPRMSTLEESPVGQREVEPEVEDRVEHQRAADRERQRDALRLPRHHRDDEPGEERERDHEAGPRHDRDRRDEYDPGGERAAHLEPV